MPADLEPKVENNPPEGKESDSIFFTPPEGTTCEPGDLLRFKVVAKTDEGKIELEFYNEQKSAGERLRVDLGKHMSKKQTDEGEY